MKTLHQISLSLLAIGLSIAPASAVEIKSVSVGAASKAHLCRKLGGKDQDPSITINHDAKAGDTIKVKMYDVLSNGRTFQHRTKTIKSEADGSTTLTADFLAPCNTTGGKANSSYRFDVTSKGSSKKTVRWFNFNSSTRKISQ
ncbi:hypothetical protein WNZ14_21845 [Hoeflea sp. AS60]|uniref:hypothetical protein n=1 Tax=Hoeflea sp. AS60 TaxID=3135780 RepID=UPI003172750F